LLRYGPYVLDEREYRNAVRRWLRRYTAWLLKQLVKPTRWRQREFYAFHRREISYMLVETEPNRETRLALLALRGLLKTSNDEAGLVVDHPAAEALGKLPG
jgi:hypothetical protein